MNGLLASDLTEIEFLENRFECSHGVLNGGMQLLADYMYLQPAQLPVELFSEPACVTPEPPGC
jgi:hypothetical protein